MSLCKNSKRQIFNLKTYAKPVGRVHLLFITERLAFACGKFENSGTANNLVGLIKVPGHSKKIIGNKFWPVREFVPLCEVEGASKRNASQSSRNAK